MVEVDAFRGNHQEVLFVVVPTKTHGALSHLSQSSNNLAQEVGYVLLEGDRIDTKLTGSLLPYTTN